MEGSSCAPCCARRFVAELAKEEAAQKREEAKEAKKEK
jgi:hypothetical protein